MTSRAVGGFLAGLALVAALTGCSSPAARSTVATVRTAASAPTTAGGPIAEDASGLVTAQHRQCDVGTKILHYLATGENGGDPALDQVFASHVGVPAPQGRALADQYIEACDQQYDRQDAAASSSAAERAAQAAASASKATDQAWCEAHGGEFADDGWTTVCGSTVDGNPSGELGGDCGGAYFWPPFTEEALTEVKADHPGCFP